MIELIIELLQVAFLIFMGVATYFAIGLVKELKEERDMVRARNIQMRQMQNFYGPNHD